MRPVCRYSPFYSLPCTSCCSLPNVHNCSFLLLPAPLCSFLLLPANLCSFLLLPAPLCSFLLLPAPLCSFLLLPAHLCSFLLHSRCLILFLILFCLFLLHLFIPPVAGVGRADVSARAGHYSLRLVTPLTTRSSLPHRVPHPPPFPIPPSVAGAGGADVLARAGHHPLRHQGRQHPHHQRDHAGWLNLLNRPQPPTSPSSQTPPLLPPLLPPFLPSPLALFPRVSHVVLFLPPPWFTPLPPPAEGLVKLADFGVAIRVEEAAACHGDAENPNVVGTPYWMAPEVIEMSGISPASDIWSVNTCGLVKLADFGVAIRVEEAAACHGDAENPNVVGTPYWMAPEVIEMSGISPASDIWSVNTCGLVKLADFGVAIRLEEAAACHGDAENPNVVGTPYWMAPEVIEMSGISPASDIWSVGCTVIELLTTKPPYFDLQPMPALFRIVQDDLPPLPENVSAATSDFLHLCFRKDTKSRPDAKTLLRHPWIHAPSQAGAGRGSDEAAAIDDSIDAARRVHATSHASSSSSPPVTLSASSPDSERRDRKIHLQADAVKDLREAAKAARKSRAQRHSMGGSIDSGAPSDRPGTAEDAGSGGVGSGGGGGGGSGISSSGIPLSGSGRRKIIRSKSDKELNARDSEGHAEGGAGGAGGKDGARRQRWKSGQGMDEEGSREFISMQGEGGVWEVSDEEDGLGKVKGGRRGAVRERAEEEDSSGEIGSGEARAAEAGAVEQHWWSSLPSPPRSHRGSRSQQQSPEGAHGRSSFEAPQKVSRSQQQSPEGAHGRASGGRSGGENFLVGSSGEEGGADQEDERNGTPAGRKARRRSQDGDGTDRVGGTGAEGGGAGKKGAGKKKEQRRSGPLSAPTGKSAKGAGKKRGSQQQQQAQQDDDSNNDNSGNIDPGSSSSLIAPRTPPQLIPRPLSTFIESEEERSLSSLTAMFAPLAGSPQVAGGSRSLAGVLRERLVRGMHRVAVKAEREGSDPFAGVEGLDAVGSGAERGEEDGGAVGVVGGVGVVGEFDSAVYGGAAGGGAERKSSLRPELLNQKVSEAAGLLSQLKPWQVSEAAGLLSQLKPSQGEEAIEVASSRLAGLVGEYPEVKGELVASHAVLPLLDVFDADSPRIVLAVLRLLQQLITDSPAIQSLLCNAGLVSNLV
ncbi:unnamed protein product [Closterium sp. Yama58-4]|nr:unnamed protein product [Closterium sp. Yama58-4]